MTKAKGKPSLVLLHGWRLVGRLGRGREDPLEELRRPPLDLPAGTREAGVGYDPVSLARYIENEMEEAGFGHAHVAGNSLGARVAGELAAASRPVS